MRHGVVLSLKYGDDRVRCRGRCDHRLICPVLHPEVAIGYPCVDVFAVGDARYICAIIGVTVHIGRECLIYDVDEMRLVVIVIVIPYADINILFRHGFSCGRIPEDGHDREGITDQGVRYEGSANEFTQDTVRWIGPAEAAGGVHRFVGVDPACTVGVVRLHRRQNGSVLTDVNRRLHQGGLHIGGRKRAVAREHQRRGPGNGRTGHGCTCHGGVLIFRVCRYDADAGRHEIWLDVGGNPVHRPHTAEGCTVVHQVVGRTDGDGVFRGSRCTDGSSAVPALVPGSESDNSTAPDHVVDGGVKDGLPIGLVALGELHPVDADRHRSGVGDGDLPDTVPSGGVRGAGCLEVIGILR
ncbi:hypothetical protein DSECCO2_596820 [anaerobic digester metagenome]